MTARVALAQTKLRFGGLVRGLDGRAARKGLRARGVLASLVLGRNLRSDRITARAHHGDTPSQNPSSFIQPETPWYREMEPGVSGDGGV